MRNLLCFMWKVVEMMLSLEGAIAILKMNLKKRM
jgi:hypothetical protein